LRDAGIERLLDVRLNNASRLAGFARRADLPFFLERLCSAEYLHEPRLAPTREILDSYRKGGRWPDYEKAFLDLLRERRVEERLDRDEHCHRRLVLEYLNRKWDGIRAVHL
jgi:primosomal protein N''